MNLDKEYEKCYELSNTIMNIIRGGEPYRQECFFKCVYDLDPKKEFPVYKKKLYSHPRGVYFAIRNNSG